MNSKPTYKELQKKLEMLEDEYVLYRQVDETYRTLVESTNDSLYIVDKDCRFLHSELLKHSQTLSCKHTPYYQYLLFASSTFQNLNHFLLFSEKTFSI